MKNFVFLLCSVFLLASCSSRKEIVYFLDAEKLDNTRNLMEFEPVLEVNDILSIQVSSFDNEVAEPFQMNSGNQQSGGGGSQNRAVQGYLVDIDGNIQFPVLGKIPVANLSRSELETYLTKEIKVSVTDAVVAVRIINFRVFVLGEAGSQTVVPVENERMSIPELFATVGGISYNGKRQNILVIRESNGLKTIGRVDITSADVFSNPFYYLKQNDIVYVEPTYRQVKSAGFITSYTGLISLGTTIMGLIFLFSR